MENLFIKGIDEKPEINFNAETGILEISKSSYPEYATGVYKPATEWLEEYLEKEGRTVEFNFKLDYFNTSTSFIFQKILNILNQYHIDNKGEVSVNWFYEDGDIDMLENGEDYSKDAKMPFNILTR